MSSLPAPPPWQMEKMIEVLQKHWGYSSLRAHQGEIVHACLAGKDCFVVMATGSGKSLCYQLPVMLYRARTKGHGTTIVVSPLVSLMEDQVMALNAMGIPACHLAAHASTETFKDAFAGKYAIVYMTPERAEGSVRALQALHDSTRVVCLAVDESHCVSDWGHDFRPAYRRLSALRFALPTVPIMALTATATPRVQSDIIKQLNLRSPVVAKTTFNRPNLFYSVRPKTSLDADMRRMMRGVDPSASVIVYCVTKRDTEAVAGALVGMGFKAAAYHAGMSHMQRTQIHGDFLRDKIQVVAATVAFGMGIDKPDIRLVVHYGVPKTVEDYYQHTGRAGRDGAPSRCECLYSAKDFNTQQFLIRDVTGTYREHLEAAMRCLREFVDTTGCRRRYLLAYFGEHGPAVPAGAAATAPSCHSCDNCVLRDKRLAAGESADSMERDFTDDARVLAKAVQELRESCGQGTVLKVLLGSMAANIKRYSRLACYGKGRGHSTAWWKAFARLAMLMGVTKSVARQMSSGSGRYQALMLGPKGTELLRRASYKLPKHAVPKYLLDAEPRKSPSVGARASGGASGSGSGSGSGQGGGKQMSPKELQMRDHLTALRARIANHNNLAPYQVFGQEVLVDLARYRPTSTALLEQVVGLGGARIAKYGSDIRRFIKQTAAKLGLDTNVVRIAAALKFVARSVSMTAGKLLVHEKFKAGTSIEDIADEKGVKRGTVVGYLGDAVMCGFKVDPRRVGITRDTELAIRAAVMQAFGEKGSDEPLKLAKVLAKLPATTPITYGDIKFVVCLMDVEAATATHTAEGIVPGSELDMARAGDGGGGISLTAESAIVSASQDSWVDTPSIPNLSRHAPTPSVPRSAWRAPASDRDVGAAGSAGGIPRRSPTGAGVASGGVAGAGASLGASDWKRRHTPARQGQLPLRRCASVTKRSLPGGTLGSASRRPPPGVTPGAFYSRDPSAPSPAVSGRTKPRIPRANSSPPALHPSQPASLEDSPQRASRGGRDTGEGGSLAARAAALPRAHSLPERQGEWGAGSGEGGGATALPTFSFGSRDPAPAPKVKPRLQRATSGGAADPASAPRKRVLPWAVGRGGSKFRRGPHRGNRIAGPAVSAQRSPSSSLESSGAGGAGRASGGVGAAAASPPAAQVTRAAVMGRIVARSPVLDTDLMRELAGQDSARRSRVQGLVQELHEELMIYKDGAGRWCAM